MVENSARMENYFSLLKRIGKVQQINRKHSISYYDLVFHLLSNIATFEATENRINKELFIEIISL